MQIKFLIIELCFSIPTVVVAYNFNYSTPSSKNLSDSGVITSKGLSYEYIAKIFQKASQYLNAKFKDVKASRKLPQSMKRGLRTISDWRSAFYPGDLWLLYNYTKTNALLQKAKFATQLVEEEKYYTKDHDIGFRIYCSFGQGYKMTNTPEYQKVIIQAAKSAITRYHPKVKAKKPWESQPERGWQYLVIIDNTINLELLFAAIKFTRDSTFYDIAVNHANTILKYQYRKDLSCSHVIDFDSITGDFRKRDWNKGNDNPKTAVWSRGQSWGLYGFAMTYRETRDLNYIQQAEIITDFILTHPNLADDMVPYWDYNALEIPTLRDASAAAIMASASMELAVLSENNNVTYFQSGEKIFKTLSSLEYFAEPGTNGNFLIKHATGDFLKYSELDVTFIYADYYFLEALSRYNNIKEYK